MQLMVHTVRYRGEEWTLASLARAHGLDRRTLQSRLDAGETVDVALRAARSYPKVKRERAERHRPPTAMPKRQVPCCDRCGEEGGLREFGREWRLCKPCCAVAGHIVRRWVASSP